MRDTVNLILSAVICFILIAVLGTVWISIEGAAYDVAHVLIKASKENFILIFNLLCIILAEYLCSNLQRRIRNKLFSVILVIQYLFLPVFLVQIIFQIIVKWPLVCSIILIICLCLLAIFSWRQLQYINRIGYSVSSKGRDYISYEERYNGVMRSLTLYRDLGDITVIHIPSDVEWDEKMPEWARGRKEEIVGRVRSFLGEKDLEYHFE